MNAAIDLSKSVYTPEQIRRQREVITKYYQAPYNYSMKHIAWMLGITERTVKERIATMGLHITYLYPDESFRQSFEYLRSNSDLARFKRDNRIIYLLNRMGLPRGVFEAYYYFNDHHKDILSYAAYVSIIETLANQGYIVTDKTMYRGVLNNMTGIDLKKEQEAVSNRVTTKIISAKEKRVVSSMPRTTFNVRVPNLNRESVLNFLRATHLPINLGQSFVLFNKAYPGSVSYKTYQRIIDTLASQNVVSVLKQRGGKGGTFTRILSVQR